MNEVVLKRGAVYYLKTDDSVGRELAIGRPVVILSNSKEIENNDCVIVGMLTNMARPGAVKVMVKNHSTYVLTDQIRTIDKNRLNSYMCTLTRQEMQKISGKLLYTLSLTGLTTTLSETDLEEEIQDGAIKEDDNILYKDMYKKAIDLVVAAQIEVEQIKKKFKIEKWEHNYEY